MSTTSEEPFRLTAEEHRQLRLALGHNSTACLDWPCVTCADTISAVEAILADRAKRIRAEARRDALGDAARRIASGWPGP